MVKRPHKLGSYRHISSYQSFLGHLINRFVRILATLLQVAHAIILSIVSRVMQNGSLLTNHFVIEASYQSFLVEEPHAIFY